MSFSSDNPLLTVAIPVYNMEKYLARCLDSVIKQSITNIEIIVVNDGSTDESMEILKKYLSIDQRIQIIEQENAGLITARETAIAYANGKYIAFLDPDDWVDYDYYEKIINFMVVNELDIGIGGFTLAYDNYEKNIFTNKEKILMDKIEAIINMLLFKNYRWELCDKIYKTSIVKKIKVDNTVTCGEDLLRNWFIFGKARNIGVIPLYGYHYYQRQGSMSKTKAITYTGTVSRVFDVLSQEVDTYGDSVAKAFGIRRNYFAVHDLYRLIKSDSISNNKTDANRLKRFIRYNLKDIILSQLPFKTKVLAVILSFFYFL